MRSGAGGLPQTRANGRFHLRPNSRGMHWGKFTVVVLAVGTFSAAAQVTVQRGALRLKEGQVTFQRPPAAPQAAPVPQPLDFGDQLQTAELSWAVVEFTDLSRLKVRELSVLEFVKPSVLVS